VLWLLVIVCIVDVDFGGWLMMMMWVYGSRCFSVGASILCSDSSCFGFVVVVVLKIIVFSGLLLVECVVVELFSICLIIGEGMLMFVMSVGLISRVCFGL